MAYFAEKDTMAVRTYVPLSSATLQRVILWGVPSLTLLGLVGVRLWFYRRNKNTAAAATDSSTATANSSSSDVPAASSCKCTRPSSPPPIGERRASAPASTISRQDEKSLYPRKNSQSEEAFQEKFATPFKVHSSGVGGKQLTSSNLHLPPLESETPLKLSSLAVAENRDHVPTTNGSAIKGDSFSSESISSESLLSQPCQSPLDITSRPAEIAAHADPRKISNHVSAPDDASDVMGQLKPEADEPDASPKDPNSLSATCRKDRVRVVLQIPRSVVGRFIGKQGRNIKSLMQASNGAHVYVNQKNVPKDTQVVMCTVQGTAVQIKDAMNIIASKYPEIQIPPYSNTVINGEGGLVHHLSPLPSAHFGASSQQTWNPWDVELLPAIIPLNSFSATICYLESETEVWLVSCEKAIELDDLHQSMSYVYCYTDFGRVNIKEGDEAMIGRYCAVRVSEIHWLRGRVMRVGDDPGSYEVQLADYGSIVVVPPSAIKALRRDHGRLPAQAFKAMLAHVDKKEGVSTESALVSLQKMVDGVMLEVHITGRLPWPSKSPLSNGGGEEVTVTSKPAWLPSAASTETDTSEAAPSNNAPPSEATPSHSFDSPTTTSASTTSSGVRSPDTSKPNLSVTFSDLSSPDSTPASASTNPTPGALPTPATTSAQPNPVSPDAQPNTSTATLSNSPLKQPELPPLAPYMPIVELYTQMGAQTPVFINRELVELGFASWKEQPVKSL